MLYAFLHAYRTLFCGTNEKKGKCLSLCGLFWNDETLDLGTGIRYGVSERRLLEASRDPINI